MVSRPRCLARGACRAGWRESWGIPQQALLVGNVARLDTVKNHAQLIEAFAILRRQAANAVLVIAGMDRCAAVSSPRPHGWEWRMEFASLERRATWRPCTASSTSAS